MNGKIHGVHGVHVDDVIGDGDETFDRIMTAVHKEFDFGACQISQMPNGEIVFDMDTSMSLSTSKCPRPTRPSPSVS